MQRKVSNVCGIEMVTAGNAAFAQNGTDYLVEPGEVFMLHTGAMHRYSPGPAGFLHKRYLTFSGSALQQLLQATDLIAVNYVRPVSPHTVSSYIKHAHKLLNTKPHGFELALSHIAYKILLELSRSIKTQFPRPVEIATEHVRKNLNRAITADEMQKICGLSQTHLNRLFRHHLGISPVRYHAQLRMAWAKHLLKESHMSIKEISAAIGYDDPLYFSSQFKKSSGKSPKFFRDD